MRDELPLQLHQAAEPQEAFGVGLGSEIAFDVDDLEEAHARAVAAGAEVVRAPSEGRAAYRDPDGAPLPETLPGAWIHADDHSAAVEAVLREGEPGAIYPLGADHLRVPLEQGLVETAEWYRANRWWWEPLKAG